MDDKPSEFTPPPLLRSRTGSKIDSFGNEEIAGAELSWKNLSFKVPDKNTSKLPWKRNKEENYKTVLQPFTGVVKSNSLMAVMGSSGAGKTTFLNALSYQFDEGSIREGNVYINNRKLTKNYFKKTCGYVRQSDVLLPNLTVKETLTFYAKLLLPMTMPTNEKKERVNSTIKKLGLSHCAHTKIGNEFKRGISGGEKRRVSIAIELLKNPAVLFLDEPTSGLDSKTALSLMNTLAELAHEYNHTIVCTIHQPRSQIFQLFDVLLLLAKGTPVYFGPADSAIEYFGAKGYHCPQYENPSDYFIDLLTLDSDTPEASEESTQRINHLIECSKEEGVDGRNRDLEKSINEISDPVPFGTFFIYQIWLLFYRSIVNTWRDSQYLFGRVTQTFFMAFAISILWWQMDNDQSAIQDRISVIFMVLLGSAFSEGLVASLVFPIERLVYVREKRSGMYRVISYYVAKQLAELPLEILVPTLFTVIVYFSVGLQYSALHFSNFILICLLLNFIVNSGGLLLGALIQVQLSTVLMPVILIFAMLFAGFYVNTENIPVFLEWAKYASMFYYAFCGVIYVEFWGRDFYCKHEQELVMTGTGVCSSGEVLTVTKRICPITHGEKIIKQLGADNLEMYQLELILLSFLVVLRILLYFALLRPPNRI